MKQGKPKRPLGQQDYLGHLTGLEAYIRVALGCGASRFLLKL